jgi:hypothetical protein
MALGKVFMKAKGLQKSSTVCFFTFNALIADEHRFKERNKVVLVPQPSGDPNDPLNWPNWKRRAAYISVAIFAGLGTWVVSGIGSGLVLIMIEFGEDLQDTVNGAINWSILTLGFGVHPPFYKDISDCRTSSGFPVPCILEQDRLSWWRLWECF